MLQFDLAVCEQQELLLMFLCLYYHHHHHNYYYRSILNRLYDLDDYDSDLESAMHVYLPLLLMPMTITFVLLNKRPSIYQLDSFNDVIPLIVIDNKE